MTALEAGLPAAEGHALNSFQRPKGYLFESWKQFLAKKQQIFGFSTGKDIVHNASADEISHYPTNANLPLFLHTLDRMFGLTYMIAAVKIQVSKVILDLSMASYASLGVVIMHQ